MVVEVTFAAVSLSRNINKKSGLSNVRGEIQLQKAKGDQDDDGATVRKNIVVM